MDRLTSIFKAGKYETDKYALGYLEHIYDHLFSERGNIGKVLEIGIKAGGSLKLWRDWFVNAEIHGVDITPCPVLANESRIVTYVKDAYSDSFLDSMPNDYDLIIDDGPHTFDSMIFFVTRYIHKVKPGGILVLEDIVDTSWTSKILDQVPSTCETTVYHMAHKQKATYLTRRWSTGLDWLNRAWQWSKSRPLLHRIVSGGSALDPFHLRNRFRESMSLHYLQKTWSKGLDVLVVKKRPCEITS